VLRRHDVIGKQPLVFWGSVGWGQRRVTERQLLQWASRTCPAALSKEVSVLLLLLCGHNGLKVLHLHSHPHATEHLVHWY